MKKGGGKIGRVCWKENGDWSIWKTERIVCHGGVCRSDILDESLKAYRMMKWNQILICGFGASSGTQAYSGPPLPYIIPQSSSNALTSTPQTLNMSQTTVVTVSKTGILYRSSQILTFCAATKFVQNVVTA